MNGIGKMVAECYRGHAPASRGEQVVLEYLPLVKKIAGRLSMALPPALDEADLIGSGIIGLLEAWERYDPSRGTSFAAYAAARIKGAMIDELRRVTPAPRSLFASLRRLQEATAQLRRDLQREPEQGEIAAALNWPPSLLDQLWAYYNLLAAVSLDQLLFGADGEESLCLEEMVAGPAETPEALLLKKEKQRQLAAALERLPAREKLVLNLYYREGLSQKEIAACLQISAVRVSQLHARAIQRLRVLLDDGS